MSQTLVLLGTGTNVGKTYFAAALTRTLNELGCPTAAFKPIESGVTPGASSDAECLALASPRPRDAGSAPEALHCYAFAEPVSPHLAARRSGVPVDLSSVTEWVGRRALQYNALRYVVIESAGGVFSPVTEADTNFEFARLFPDALWVLIAPDGLGVLHDVTACLEAMGQRGRRPDFVALCAARAQDASTGTNGAELERLGITRVAAVLGRDAPQDLRPFAERLAAADAENPGQAG